MTASTVRFDTAQLAALRVALEKLAPKNVRLCEIVQFVIIIDANSVIADLVYRVRHPERGATSLEGLIRATVLVAHAPMWLDAEMVSAIPQAAASCKVSELLLWKQWGEFRTLIIWDEALREPRAPQGGCCDPKDAPYIELETKLRASGILTKDSDIAKMGGHCLSHQFVLSTRAYARAIVPVVGIRLLGVVIPVVAGAVLVESVRAAARAVSRIPDPVKVLLIVSALGAFVHAGFRKRLGKFCVSLGDLLAVAGPVMQEALTVLASLHAKSLAAAETHLATSVSLVRPPPVLTRRPRPLRRRARARVARRGNDKCIPK
jgi:hypothetical protein